MTPRNRTRRRPGLRPLVALLALLGIAALSLAAARATQRAAPTPTERIDVEQAVDFPYDI